MASLGSGSNGGGDGNSGSNTPSTGSWDRSVSEYDKGLKKELVATLREEGRASAAGGGGSANKSLTLSQLMQALVRRGNFKVLRDGQPCKVKTLVKAYWGTLPPHFGHPVSAPCFTCCAPYWLWWPYASEPSVAVL